MSIVTTDGPIAKPNEGHRDYDYLLERYNELFDQLTEEKQRNSELQTKVYFLDPKIHFLDWYWRLRMLDDDVAVRAYHEYCNEFPPEPYVERYKETSYYQAEWPKTLIGYSDDEEDE